MSTFYQLFCECAERWPANIALEIQRGDRVESYTYAEVRRMAESVARWLTDQRLEPGARIAILAANHPRWVASYLGIIAAGCTAVPLDTALHADQIETLLKDSGSSLLFCDRKHFFLARNAGRSLGVRLVLTDPREALTDRAESGGTPNPGSSVAEPPLVDAPVFADLDSIFAAGPGEFVAVESSSDSLASLLYTSGTTADPKGVMLAHANLLGEVKAVFGWVNIGPEDAVLGVLPLFHVLSQMANLLLPLVKGARVVHLETLNTAELLRALRDRKITAFAVVPQFFYLIHERIFKEVAQRGKLASRLVRMLIAITRFSRRFGLNLGKIFFGRIHALFGDHMRYLVTGGSRFDPQIGRDFYALGIDILQAYGLTETTGGAFATPVDNNVIGSVGPPLPGIEGRIVDPQPLEEGGELVGEILIRGPIVMKGYWNRPEATAAALRDGWLYTGDLGYFDAHGNLFITGRKKEVIVLSNGKNVYPEEVEAHYQKSPFIKEVCVSAVEARPGEPTSEHLHAVIVPDFEVLKQRRIVNAREVIRFDIEGLSAQLPSTKRIGSFEIWQEDLPRTTTRKLKRFEIEKRVRANQARGAADVDLSLEQPLPEADRAWLDQPEVQPTLKVIGEAARCRVDSIRPGHNLELDLGLDSMQRVELLVALEQELGGDLPESQLSGIYTVRELVDAVRESAGRDRSPHAPFAGWGVVLQEDAPRSETDALIRPRPVAEASWYLLSRFLQIMARDRCQLRVIDAEKLPAHGPFILCSNHQSFLDPVILGSVLPWPVFRDTVSVGTSEIFGSGFMRRLARSLRVIVVDPDANLIPAMRAGAFALRHGRVLILYPEGERSIDGSPKVFKKGAAILSIHSQVPIIPIAIEGFHDLWPRGKPFQGFARLTIAFGDPLYPLPESQASESAYETLTAELKARVVQMREKLRRERART